MKLTLDIPGHKSLPRYMHCVFEVADVSALQAVAAGRANEEQQKRFFGWLVNDCTAHYDVSYQPDSERGTAFAEGRRYVGACLVALLKRSTADLAARARPNRGA